MDAVDLFPVVALLCVEKGEPAAVGSLDWRAMSSAVDKNRAEATCDSRGGRQGGHCCTVKMFQSRLPRSYSRDDPPGSQKDQSVGFPAQEFRLSEVALDQVCMMYGSIIHTCSSVTPCCWFLPFGRSSREQLFGRLAGIRSGLRRAG